MNRIDNTCINAALHAYYDDLADGFKDSACYKVLKSCNYHIAEF